MEGTTVRHVSCCMLVSDGCCHICKHYKNSSLVRQLRRITGSKESESAQCSISSHTNYRFLSIAQRDERLKRMHSELRTKIKRLHTLQTAVEELHNSDTISMDDDMGADFKELMKKYASTVEHSHKKGSFQSLFWKQQMDAVAKSNLRSVRWHPLIIKWCLYLHHRYNIGLSVCC